MAAGTSCSDGNFCNGEETCNASGVCSAGTAPAAALADDHNACTTDSCDPTKGGIVNQPIPGCASTAGATPLESTASASVGASTAFLYTGANPIQTGVAAGTIDTERAAVVRGRVLASDGTTPSPGATVTILGHGEYGQTTTRADGFYDLAVNGGGPLTVQIVAANALKLQRTANTKARGWTIVDDVVLTAPYTSPDAFTPGAATTQLVRGQLTPAGTDTDGARRATIYFPKNTSITNFAAPAGPLAMQVTEFTGANGPRRMPGDLPPTSGYTYALAVSLPAATTAGVEDVTFDKPVVLYVDNFTNFPVGAVVPLGYYNRAKGAWEAEKSGRIIRIASISAGLATLDVGNSPEPVTPPIDDDERRSLASNFTVNTVLWRAGVQHFSEWDANWGFSLPPPAPSAPPPPAPKDDDPDDPCEIQGSIIGCESRTLGERIPVVGTPFSLHYQSRRSAGFRNRIRLKLTDGTALPGSMQRARIIIEAAGRRYEYVKEAPLALNETFTWTWNGLDAYDREVNHGSIDARVRVGFEYSNSQTFSTPVFGAAGPANGSAIAGNRGARIITLWKESVYPLARSPAKSLGFGGWTLDANHILDNNDTIFFGDGKRRELDKQGFAVGPVAGGGAFNNYNDGGSAVGAFLGRIEDIVHAPDGTLYVLSNSNSGRIRRISPTGIIDTIAGAGAVVPRSAASDGANAINAQTFGSQGALAPDGSLVFVEPNTNQVWKITAEATPKLRLVAGTGAAGAANDCALLNCGDGGPATAAKISYPTSVAVGTDGTIFVVDQGHSRVRRIGPEGTISTYFADAGDRVQQISVRADGTLLARRYNDGVVRIEPNGSPSNVTEPGGAASNMASWCRMGGASFFGAFVLRPDDSIVLTCYASVVVRSPEGRVSRVAGSETAYGTSGDGGPALRALFQYLRPVAIGNRNDIFVADQGNGRIRRLHHAAGATNLTTVRVPSEDGSEVYEFSLEGRHERTLSALGGVPRFTFGYDSTSGQLSSITDMAGNVSHIARAGTGVTITAPFGQVTQLALDTNGYLASITNPVTTEVTQLVHSTSGLLTALTDPRGGKHQFEYAPDGRLTRDIDATPGSPGTRLTTLTDATGWTVEIASPEGRVTRHKVDDGSAFADTAVKQRRTVSRGGLATTSDVAGDGARTTVRPDGSIEKVLSMAADPRWGVAASYPSAVQIDIAGRIMTTTESRTATLAIPGDPFSAIAETISTTRSAAGGVPPSSTTTSVFSAGPAAKWTTTSQQGVILEETLDSLERVVRTKVVNTSPLALHPVDYAYDALGRLKDVTWGARTFHIDYDAAGWPLRTTAPAGTVEYPTRDANGRPLTVILPGSRTLAINYDPAGNMASVTPPSDAAIPPSHAFSFDPNNRMASYAPPDLVPTLSTKNTTYGRDLDGLLLAASHPSKSVTYEYDALGRLTRRVDVATTSRSYDTLGHLWTVASDGVTLTNTWEASLLTQQQVAGPFTRTLSKSYDKFLRVSSWSVDSGAGTVSVSYDGDDRVVASGGMSVTRGGNGLLTGTTAGSVSDGFEYNAYAEVTRHFVAGASASPFDVTTTRDGAGRIDVRTETIGSVTKSYRYGYDAAGRLAEVFEDGAATSARAWTYDANGNRLDGVYDEQDRLSAMGGAGFTYGNNGERATKTEGGLVTGYVYDAHGNLRSVALPPNLALGTPARTLEYVIDGQNRRLGKKMGASLVQGFVYDGSRIVAELGSNGAEVARFVYTTGGYSPDVMIKAGTTYRIVKDHLGSPRMVVSGSGVVAQRMDYDEWGNVRFDTAPGFQPFGFAGGLWDRDTSLLRFGARDYDPATGRWTSKDASRMRGGLNLYAYCHGDPLNFVDPSGHRDMAATLAAAAAAARAAAVSAAARAAAARVAVAAGAQAAAVAAMGVVAVGFCAVVDCSNNAGPGADSAGGPAPAPGDAPASGPAGGSAAGSAGGTCDPPPSGDDDEEDDCKRKASPWELKNAGIDAHATKKGVVGNAGGHYDICKCDSGGFAVKRLGCTGPIVERL